MWKPIDGYPDYLINRQGHIYRKSTKSIYVDKKSISLKDEAGIWVNRSVNKLVNEAFGPDGGLIKATPIQPGEPTQYFQSIKQAAIWLHTNNKAVTAGRLAAYSTIRTNVSLGLTHPDLYPYMYGYSWEIQSEE